MSWESRELRILKALANLEKDREPGRDINLHDLVAATSMDINSLIIGIMALTDGAFTTAKPLRGDGRIMTIHGVGLLPAGRRAIGEWPSADTVEASKERRFRFMRHLFSVTGGNRLEAIAADELGGQLGWSPNETSAVTDYLENEGLIEFSGMGNGGQVSITHLGIKEVEQSLSKPDNPTEHFPPASSLMVILGDVSNSQLQVGAVSSSQTQSVLDADEIVAIERFLVEVQKNLPSLPLSPIDKAEMEQDIKTARTLLSTNPKKRLVREALATVRTLVEGVAGNAAFAGLVELARHIHL